MTPIIIIIITLLSFSAGLVLGRTWKKNGQASKLKMTVGTIERK